MESETIWVKDFQRELHATQNKLRDLRDYVTKEIFDNQAAHLPNLETSRDSYRKRVDEFKKKWGVQSIPIPDRPARDVALMAARHEAPFPDQDKGFRDGLICLSLLEHMKAGNRFALVSRDPLFKSAAIERLAEERGVTLRIFASLEEISEALLRMRVLDFIEQYEARRQQVLAALEADAALVEFISNNLSLPQSFFGFSLTLRSVHGWKVTGVKKVRVPIL